MAVKLFRSTDYALLPYCQVHVTKWADGAFPGRTEHEALSKLVLEEIPELLDHIRRKGKADIGLELADCFILLIDLATLWGVDLGAAIEDKMAINRARTWARDPTSGAMRHVEEAESEGGHHD